MSKMASFLPLIVGFGGYNAAGRSSGDLAYNRMVFDSLSNARQQETVRSLAALMQLDKNLPYDILKANVLNGSLVRKIGPDLFDVNHALSARKISEFGDSSANQYIMPKRDLPSPLPANWTAEPLDESGASFRVTVCQNDTLMVDTPSPMAVQSAGQLPTGFDPSSHYRSIHHPRGLQLTILGASDAVQSMGLDWSAVCDLVKPDQIGVYSSSVMSQLDGTGFGGMMQARVRGQRTSSKQLALGLNSMPADFVNAYVLGSVGSTASITGACASFLYNLQQASEDIKSGRRKVAVVGCAEAPILPEVIDGYAAMSALATDANLCALDGVSTPDYTRASRPFGENCGFTIAESSQYVVLMADDLALEMGAQIFGAVPGVYVNADGFKKSISAPGAGNYITMAKAVGLAQTLLGKNAVQHGSFIQAHGSSTPQNRVTESKIFDTVAKGFDISNWSVSAVKAYLGHSLGPASGDQMAATLGVFSQGIIPGIKTISGIADDVYADRLAIHCADEQKDQRDLKVAFLNSKGFGGNNATATVFSPTVAKQFLVSKHGKAAVTLYESKLSTTTEHAATYLDKANKGQLDPLYHFGKNMIDEHDIALSESQMKIPGYKHAISLDIDEGYSDLFTP